MVASMKSTIFWDAVGKLLACLVLGLLFALKMDAVCFSKTSVFFYQTTWHHIPEESTFNAVIHTKYITYLKTGF
jgi:hypothetical protein